MFYDFDKLIKFTFICLLLIGILIGSCLVGAGLYIGKQASKYEIRIR